MDRSSSRDEANLSSSGPLLQTDQRKVIHKKRRWHNHLDPHINREPWTQAEEAIVFEAHSKIGSRWKDIASLLSSRTDNSVKNHFYSTLRRSLRRMNKYLGFKNSTNQMRVLKPSILGRLIEEGETSEDARGKSVFNLSADQWNISVFKI